MSFRSRALGLAAGLAALSLSVSGCALVGAAAASNDVPEKDPLAISTFEAPSDAVTSDADASYKPDVFQDEDSVDCSTQKCIALTFDDGPNPQHTPRVLAALARWNVRATFFVQGKFAAAYPELIRQEVAAGHIVGSHTYDHPELTRVSAEAIDSQIARTDAAIAAALGFSKDTKSVPQGFEIYTPAAPAPAQPDQQAPAQTAAPASQIRTQWMRPPYGAVNSTVYHQLAAHGKTAVLWSVDTEDWKNRSVEVSTQRALEGIQPGSVVLFHDVHPVAEDALDGLLAQLTEQGYHCVTIDKLLSGKKTPGQPIFSRQTIFPG